MSQPPGIINVHARLQLIRLLSELSEQDATTFDSFWIDLFRSKNEHDMGAIIETALALKRKHLRTDTLRGIQPRCYQSELFQRVAVSTNNYIAFLPTGAGKTLVAYLYMDYMLRARTEKHIVFLAMSVALASQQYLRFMEFTGLDRTTCALFYGGHTSNDSTIENFKVIFTTPQAYINMLNARQAFIHHCSLLVFDEAHHARKGHPYAQIMRDYVKRELVIDRPRIFGMTASPGEGRDLNDTLQSITTLEQTMDAKITMPILPDSLEELRAHTALSDTYVAVYEVGVSDGSTLDALSVYIRSCVSLLLVQEKQDRSSQMNTGRSTPFVPQGSFSAWNANDNGLSRYGQPIHAATQDQSGPLYRAELIDQLTLLYEVFRQGQEKLTPTDAQGPRFMYIVEMLEQNTGTSPVKAMLASMLKAWELMDGLIDFGADAVHNDIHELSQAYHEQTQYAHYYRDFLEAWNQKKFELGHFLKNATTEGSGQGKVATLVTQLSVMGPASKVMVFVQTRASALKLAKYLDATFPQMRAGAIVGKAEMTPSNQLSVARKFNEGHFRVLVATSVVEEGIDVQSCDLVIRLDGTSTAKSFIQSRGRARNMSSRYILVVMEEEKAQLDMIMKREQFMNAAVRHLCDPDGLRRDGVDINALYQAYHQMEAQITPNSYAFTRLHEYYQRSGIPLPDIVIQGSVSPFIASINHKGTVYRGSGQTKQDAKFRAAEKAWNAIIQSSPHLQRQQAYSPPLTNSVYPNTVSPSHSAANLDYYAPGMEVDDHPEYSASPYAPAMHSPYSQSTNASYQTQSASYYDQTGNGSMQDSSYYQSFPSNGSMASSSSKPLPNTSTVVHNEPPDGAVKIEIHRAPEPIIKSEYGPPSPLASSSSSGASSSSASGSYHSAPSQASMYPMPPPGFIAPSPTAYAAAPSASPYAAPYQASASAYASQSQSPPYSGGSSPYSNAPMNSSQYSPYRNGMSSAPPAPTQGVEFAPNFRLPVRVSGQPNPGNAIGSLQEVFQKAQLRPPDYDDVCGDQHAGFTVSCKIPGLTVIAHAMQKKAAKTQAAIKMWNALQDASHY